MIPPYLPGPIIAHRWAVRLVMGWSDSRAWLRPASEPGSSPGMGSTPYFKIERERRAFPQCPDDGTCRACRAYSLPRPPGHALTPRGPPRVISLGPRPLLRRGIAGPLAQVLLSPSASTPWPPGFRLVQAVPPPGRLSSPAGGHPQDKSRGRKCQSCQVSYSPRDNRQEKKVSKIIACGHFQRF